MGLLDFLSGVLSTAARNTIQQRNDFARKYAREHPNMDESTKAKLDAFNTKTESLHTAGEKISSSVSSIATVASALSFDDSQSYLGKTISGWDTEWISIGYLKNADLTPYNHCVGLYRHTINGETRYLGRAIELNNGGFRKRLSDYRRDSESARKHQSGQTIYTHLEEIETYILIIGDTEEAVQATKTLEKAFINKYNPDWNKVKYNS
ncbi:MAG: hypothetical protein IJ489_01085 [Clostridia bacterium]|nr:hypothetical protein [Clostridia bacterium]